MEDPRNHLTMETAAFGYLDEKPLLSAEEKVDPRLGKITIRQLLHHSGGWDRDKSGDPMFDHSIDFAELAHRAPPTDPRTMVRGMMGKALDFDPGERKAYSNFGYCVLGRIIEKASGMTYENYVKEKVLAPMGITDMYVGRTLESGRGAREVRYYQDDDGEAMSIFPTGPRKAPNPYGTWCLETMDAHGGWVATAVDMARFITSVDHFLKPESMELFVERPAVTTKERVGGAYYACGVMAKPFHDGGRTTYSLWHDGSLPGTFAFLVRRHDGVTWAVLFNQRAVDGKKLADIAIDKELHRAADSVREWPTGDLFQNNHR
jgi:N-acyl-D-amino-acid deacylase